MSSMLKLINGFRKITGKPKLIETNKAIILVYVPGLCKTFEYNVLIHEGGKKQEVKKEYENSYMWKISDDFSIEILGGEFTFSSTQLYDILLNKYIKLSQLFIDENGKEYWKKSQYI